ncbi:hypothetical protein F5X98DRAFT_328500 [Xylaria grammica]|nr:hypothetical protein F5X98DRAFT_328500 [Xylaria grammica]
MSEVGGSTVVGADRPPHRLKRHYTRTRSGCERCRAQRRKCDEGKPRCRRCADAGAVCKYVKHVSFKNNTQTLSKNVAPNPAASSTENYPTIEFVLNDGGGGGVKFSNHSSDSTDGARLDNQSSPPGALQSSSGLGSVPAEGWPLVGQSPLSNAEVELLKYYSHHIAPWLDVYDQNQTFGNHVPRLAMASPCVLELLLHVSAVFSSRPVEIVQRRGAGLFHLQAMSNPPGIESPSSALRTIACFVLARTLLFVDSIPDTWECNFQGDGAFLYFRRFNFLDIGQRRMWFAFLTLILRLEVAYCLMNQRAPVWISELAHQIQTQWGMGNSGANGPGGIFNASLCCLKLLIDVMNFSFPPFNASDATTVLGQISASTTPSTSRADKWNELSNGLHAWYTSRPLRLEPLAEVEHPESAFPTVIFPTGAGVSSNILYHTAMLLLLNKKPQRVSFNEHNTESGMDMAQMSAHWHTHRICGIAIHSDPVSTNCWDPVMIASFSLAAKEAKSSSQQNDIVLFLEQLRVAGWHINGLANRLRRQWSP